MIRFQTVRATKWFDDGLRLRSMLDPRSSACAGAMAGIYRRLLAAHRARSGGRLAGTRGAAGLGEGAGRGAEPGGQVSAAPVVVAGRRPGRNQRGAGAGGRGSASDVAGSPRAAGRRHLLVSARRALAGQRPARIPALLHGLPCVHRADWRKRPGDAPTAAGHPRSSIPSAASAAWRGPTCPRRCT